VPGAGRDVARSTGAPARSPRRLLLVHAHPDDESITTGATMARYAAEGAHVTLVTGTLGEEGEILVPELAHLAADRDDALGQHRGTELAAAMAELGVTDYRLLGGPGRFRDSGMLGTPPNDRPGCLWRADLREAADALVPVVREVRPQVLVTYDDNGGYGHPDHIQAHRVATYAAALAAAPSYRRDLGAAWAVRKIYWTTMPRSSVQAGIDRVAATGGDVPSLGAADDVPFATPDDLVTTCVDGTAYLDRKLAAMRAHATQLTVEVIGGEPFFALSNGIRQYAWGREWYRLVAGAPGPRDPRTGWEDDLFAGVSADP
jgi:N-acetyl-1-D-myo-inositol-2-amino-2-deoxy-alpha-D-glucopyranoside deacetylase